MQAGRLKYTVTFLQKTKERDGYGSEREVWSVAFVVKTDIVFKSGTKVVSDNEVFNTQVIEVRMRYRRGIDESMRIRIDERLYKILFINEPEYRKSLVINVERVNE